MTETGPPYPAPPAAGSNAIGSFQIGVSPIGDITAFDFWTTIIAQYANSPALTGIIESFDDAADLTTEFENFYDMIWNIQTAQGYGLDVWGRIVGITRTITVQTVRYFGFEEQQDTTDPFNTSPFYSGEPDTANYILEDNSYRMLILAKAAANVTNGSVPAINQILLGLFPGRGNCYCTDNGNMTMTYTFTFPLTAVELAIVSHSNVLPKSTGVAVSIVQPA